MTEAAANPPLLSVSALGCIRSDRVLFANLNFDVSAGEVVVVEGRNGSGKTSLLRLLTGLSEPEDGEIRWNGTKIQDDRETYLANLLYLGHLPAVKGELTAGENLRLMMKIGKERKTEAAEAFEKLGLKGFEDMPTRFLSAGQRRRVALARLFSSHATLWILDEPLTAIDVHGVKIIEGTISAHAKSGGAVVMTTHQAIDIPDVPVKSVTLGRKLKTAHV